MTKQEYYNEIWRLNQALSEIVHNPGSRCLYMAEPCQLDAPTPTVAGFAQQHLTKDLLSYAPCETTDSPEVEDD